MPAASQALQPSAPGSSRRPIAARDPRTGEVWRTWPHPSEDTVHATVATARAGQPAWAGRSLRERIAIIQRFRAACFARRHEIAALIEREVGKSQADALAADVIVTLDLARYFCGIAPRVLRPKRETGASLAMLRKVIEIRREPFGVVAVISPWNYPMMLAAGVIIPALLAGNAVILKPSEYSTATAELLIDLLLQAGVPPAVCTCLPGDALTGATLIEAGIDKVFFTGSVRGGRAVAAAAGERMIPVNLELGGNDAAIVLADCDMAFAVRGLLWGRFFTAGQTCVAPKRIFVESAVHDTFVAAMQEAMAAIRAGGTAAHVGPLVRPQQVVTLTTQVDDAVAQGARVAARSPVAPDSNQLDGAEPTQAVPTLLVDVPPDARIMHEEAFGPLMAVVRVNDAAEAVSLANASEFGLSASIWTRDAARGAALAGQLEAGTVLLNDVVVNVGIPNLPHGGVKSSGTGRSHGAEGLLECTQVRTLVRDRVRWMPQPWWFDGEPDHTPFLDAVARTAHAPSLLARLRGGIDALRFWPRR